MSNLFSERIKTQEEREAENKVKEDKSFISSLKDTVKHHYPSLRDEPYDLRLELFHNWFYAIPLEKVDRYTYNYLEICTKCGKAEISTKYQGRIFLGFIDLNDPKNYLKGESQFISKEQEAK